MSDQVRNARLYHIAAISMIHAHYTVCGLMTENQLAAFEAAINDQESILTIWDYIQTCQFPPSVAHAVWNAVCRTSIDFVTLHSIIKNDAVIKEFTNEQLEELDRRIRLLAFPLIYCTRLDVLRNPSDSQLILESVFCYSNRWPNAKLAVKVFQDPSIKTPKQFEQAYTTAVATDPTL